MTRKYCFKFETKKCDYLCSVCDGDGIEKNSFKKEWIGKPKYVEFEDTKLLVPEKSDAILRKTYGNYMKIPSQEERDRNQHEIIYLNLNNTDSKKE